MHLTAFGERMLWLTLLSTIALGWTTPIPLMDDSEEIDEPCFEPCYCEVKEGLFHVHCDSKGFTNVSQVAQSWLRPFKLYLQKNSLRKLYFNSFLHLNNAISINLGNNALQDIHVGAFNGLSFLRRLYLHENKLEVFRNDTFLGLEGLEYLQADYNVIKRIDSGAFRNLHKLRVLILNDNLIPLLPTFLFRTVSLTHLDLRGNRLKMLAYRGTLEYIGRSLMEIQLEENPWNCVCDIVQLQAWLERIPYTAVVGEITCEYPFHLHGKDLREIKRSELCPMLTEAEVEANLGIPHLPFYTERIRPTKPSSMVSPNTLSSVEQKERPPKPTKRPRPSKTPPTPRSAFPNQPPIAGYQTRPPIPIICPIGCTCNLHINDLGLTVNCKENGFRNISELMPRPLNAKKLYLSGNLIQRIHKSDFWNFSSLDLLHLGNNQIFDVQEGSFSNLPNLRSLYLNGNNIEKLTLDMFHGLQSLRYLYFEYNEIREIHPGAFSLMPTLQLVFLNNNLLCTLPVGAFAGTLLTRLNLRNNYFHHLPVSGVLDHLHAVVQIDLNQNPWDCSCDIIPLKEWLDTLSSVVIVGEVVCKTPEAMNGKDLRSLPTEMICPELLQTSLSPEIWMKGLSTSFPGAGPHPTKGAIPLSVLILSLLILFMSAFFAAAALCAYALKKREKLPFRKQGEVGLAGIQMECGIFTEPSPTLPETPPSNHVYDCIAAPSAHMSQDAIYKSSRQEDQKHPFTEPGESDSNYRTMVDKEKEWTMAVSSSPINTIVSLGMPCADIAGLHENGILCPTVIDSQGPTPKVGFVDSLFGTPAFSDVSDKHVHSPPEYPCTEQDPRQTGARTGCPNQIHRDYPELRARLKTKVDYIDVLERSYQF